MNNSSNKKLNMQFVSICAKNIRALSKKKKETEFFCNFRLNAFKQWSRMAVPSWGSFSRICINFDDIQMFSPKNSKKDINIFSKLRSGASPEKKEVSFALDTVIDSLSIKTTFQEKLSKDGVIFCSISDAIRNYPNLVARFIGTVVNPRDNFFSALNSIAFSDGSFCYIPQNTKCPIDLSTYFHIQNKNIGQFERTLIVAEKNGEVTYLEGCTAEQQSNNQLHAAVVEIIAFDNAAVHYSTVQNWFAGDSLGNGGILNFVTKRALCLGKNSKVSWTQAETGSAKTWKYPGCVLLGQGSSGEFFSVAMTSDTQETDTGTKMLHLAPLTTSRIISKSVSSKKSKTTYRGFIKISNNSHNTKNYSQCDSLLIGKLSKAYAYPHFMVCNSTSSVEHEAKISKLSNEQLFYLQQRGFTAEESTSLLVTGFCQDILSKLPLEFAVEAQELLSKKLNLNSSYSYEKC